MTQTMSNVINLSLLQEGGQLSGDISGKEENGVSISPQPPAATPDSLRVRA